MTKIEQRILNVLKEKMSLDLFERELSEQELLFCERLTEKLSALKAIEVKVVSCDVSNLLERASWLVGNPGTNISGITDIACDKWQKDYEFYRDNLIKKI